MVIKSRGRTYHNIVNRERTKGQTMIYKTLHRRVKIKQQKYHKNPGVGSCAPAG